MTADDREIGEFGGHGVEIGDRATWLRRQQRPGVADLQAEGDAELDALGSDQLVMLKLTLPEADNFYAECVKHANVVRVVALSGGYSREEANARLSRNNGMIASFSRALSEGLNAQQTADEFNSMLDTSIEAIFQASKT